MDFGLQKWVPWFFHCTFIPSTCSLLCLVLTASKDLEFSSHRVTTASLLSVMPGFLNASYSKLVFLSAKRVCLSDSTSKHLEINPSH